MYYNLYKINLLSTAGVESLIKVIFKVIFDTMSSKLAFSFQTFPSASLLTGIIGMSHQAQL